MNQLRVIEGTWIDSQKHGFLILRCTDRGFLCPLTARPMEAISKKGVVDIDNIFLPMEGECGRIGMYVSQEH